jgi:hypothetical protein
MEMVNRIEALPHLIPMLMFCGNWLSKLTIIKIVRSRQYWIKNRKKKVRLLLQIYNPQIQRVINPLTQLSTLVKSL